MTLNRDSLTLSSLTPLINSSPAPEPDLPPLPPTQPDFFAHAEQTHPVAPAARSQTWWQWTKQQASNVGLASLALITALPNMVNGLVAHENAPAKNILDSQWWKKLTFLQFSHAVANGGSALLINFILNLFFLPLAAKKFRYNITHFQENPIKFSISLFFGVAGALGAATIAYDAFSWFPDTYLGEVFAGSAALINFVIYVATRYVGMANSLERAFNLFDENIKTQRQLVYTLAHLKPHYKNTLRPIYEALSQRHLHLNTPNAHITHAQIQALTLELGQALEDFSQLHPDFIEHQTQFSQWLSGLLVLVDLSLAVGLVSWSSGLTFMQAGFNGMNKLTLLAAGENLQDLNPWWQRLIGLAPGLASSVLYTLSTYDLREVAQQVAQQLGQDLDTGDIATAIILSTCLLFSTSSMQNVAANVVKNDDNIAFVHNDNGGQAFIRLNQLGGLGVNGTATFKKIFLSPTHTQAQFTHLDNVVHYLRRSNEHRLDPDTCHALRQLSFFEQAQPTPLPTVNTEPTSASNLLRQSRN